MTDINLLKDTRFPEEKRKKEKKFSDSPLTHPGKPEKPTPEPKSPSSFSLFFKSLFRQKPKEEKPAVIEERVISPPPPSPLPPPPPPQAEKIEDIFENKSKEEEKRPASPREEKAKILPSFELFKKTERAPKKKEDKPEKKKEQSFLVNLLPEELVGREEPRKKILNLSFMALGAVVLVALVYSGLYFYQTIIVTKTQEVKTQRLALETQIQSRQNEQNESLQFKQRLDNVKTMLDSHIYWTKFFEKLEYYTLPNVYYTGGFNASTASQLTLQAVAPDFKSVAEQLVVLQNAPDFVESVSITGAQLQEGEAGPELPAGSIITGQVNFSISLTLVPDIFYKKTDEPVSTDDNVNTNINLNTNTSVNENTNINLELDLNLNENQNLNADFTENINSNPVL